MPYFKFDRDTVWNSLLKVATKVLSIKSLDDVISTIKVELYDGNLRIMLTDMQNFIVSDIEALESDGELDIVLDGASFYASVKQAKSGSVIEVRHVPGAFNVSVSSDRASSKIPIKDDTMYPFSLFDIPSEEYTFGASEFVKGLLVTSPAIKNSVYRASLRAIHIGNAGMDSTNGKSFHRVSSIKTNKDFYIPFKTAAILAELIKGSESGTLSISHDKDFTYFKVGTVTLMYIIGDYEFPMLDDIINTAKSLNTISANVDASELAWAYDYIVSHSTNKEPVLTITLQHNSIKLSLRELAEATSEVVVIYSGPSASATLDASLLAAFIKTLKSDKTAVSFSSGNAQAPILLENGDSLSLIAQVAV